jgi:hypothetical protein
VCACASDDALAPHVTRMLRWRLAHTTDVKARQSVRWVDDVMEEILVARKRTPDARTRWRLGCWGRPHPVLEVRVCASSHEVSHNFRVEIVGKVKRSPSELQQKKKKNEIKNRDWRK